MHYWVTVFTERFPNKGKLFSDLLKSLACTTHDVKFLEQYSTIFPPSDVLLYFYFKQTLIKTILSAISQVDAIKSRINTT